MTDAQMKLEKFVQENNREIQEGNFIRLFIKLKDDVITLSRSLYEYPDIPHQPITEFEALLKQQYLNRDKEQTYGGDYKHLAYYWENKQKALIPGYMGTDNEVNAHFVEIIAANFEVHWFQSEEFQYSTQFKHRINWRGLHFSLLDFFYDQKKIKHNDWTKLIALLTPFHSSIGYGNFIEGIKQIQSHLSAWPDNISNYTDYYHKWENEFGTTLPFPINRFNIYAEITKAVKKGLEEKLKVLSEEKLQAKNSSAVTATHLDLQKKILIENETDLATANSKYLSKLKATDYSEPISMPSFNNIIAKRIAAQFINELSKQDAITPASRTTSSASRSDLSVVGQIMLYYGLFDDKTSVYNFLSANFEVLSEVTNKHFVTTGKSINDAWNNIKGDDNFDKWEKISKQISAKIKDPKH